MFTKRTLPNGLRILTAPMQGTNTVTIFVYCATGSDHEQKHENGISHFLEHMFFKGTTNRPSAKIVREELVGMGSASNAFTDHETTGYYIKAGKPYADRAINILADIYSNSLLAGEEVDRERQVIIEELHLRRDTPTTYIWDLWERFLYGDQPAGWDIGGSEDVIRRLQRDEFVKYFSHQYVAANTAVIAAGSLDEAATVRRITELFSNVRNTSPQRSKPPVVEEQRAPRLHVEERKTDQTHLIIGFRGYDAFHPRRHAASLLATVLGGNWSSRMFVRIRELLGLAYHVSSESETYSNRGTLTTYAGVAHENVTKAVGAILDEYRRIREELVAPEELARTKNFLKGRMLMSLEASDAVAGFVGSEEMLTAKPLTPDEVFAIIDALTAEDLRAAAGELFRRERLNAVALGPAADAAGLQSLLDSFS